MPMHRSHEICIWLNNLGNLTLRRSVNKNFTNTYYLAIYVESLVMTHVHEAKNVVSSSEKRL